MPQKRAPRGTQSTWADGARPPCTRSVLFRFLSSIRNVLQWHLCPPPRKIPAMRFAVFAGVVLVPAVALSVFSWRAYRSEEAERASEVRRQSAIALRATLADVESQLRNARERGWKRTRPPQTRPLSPAIPLDERLARENPTLAESYERAVKLEFEARKPSEACGLYAALEAEAETEGTRAALLWAQARAGRSKAIYERIAVEFGSIPGESGIPLGALAAVRLFELDPSADRAARIAREFDEAGLSASLRLLLLEDRPFLRPLIEEAKALALAENGIARGVPSDRFVRIDGHPWLISVRPPAAIPLRLDELKLAGADGFVFEIDGESGERLASSEFPGLALGVRLADASRLRVPKGRLLLTGALLGCLVAALGLGIFAMFRNVRGELRSARLKSEFVAGVSHDLRTPITSIRMFAEMLTDGRTTEEARRDYPRLIHRESLRLSRMVENVLDFSRIEDGRKQYALAPQALNPLVQEAAQAFRSREIEIRSTIPKDAIRAKVDRDAVVSAVQNLLDNAVKYGRGPIELELSARGEISVQDHGPGVLPEERERVFEKFYRGAAAGGPSGGAGLGLFLVRHTMEAHGGSVSVDGARFVLRFPEWRESSS